MPDATTFSVKKRDDGLQLYLDCCGDCCGFNLITCKTWDLLPNFSKTFDCVVNFKVQTKLKIQSAYNPVSVKSGDE